MTQIRLDIAQELIEVGKKLAEVLGEGWELTSIVGGANLTDGTRAVYMTHTRNGNVLDDSMTFKLNFALELIERLAPATEEQPDD